MSLTIIPADPALLHVASCNINATPLSTDPTMVELELELNLNPGCELVFFPDPIVGTGETLMNHIYIFTQPTPNAVTLYVPKILGIGLVDTDYDFDLYFCEFTTPDNTMINVENYLTQTNALPPKPKVINYKHPGARKNDENPKRPSKRAFNPIKKLINPIKHKLNVDFKTNTTATKAEINKLKRK